MTPQEIEISNKKYDERQKRNKLEIKNFLTTANSEQWEEILNALWKYHLEYHIECFDELKLDYD